MPKQDLDRSVDPIKVHSRGSEMKYILVAVVSVLATLGLVASGFFISRFLEPKSAIAPSNPQVSPSTAQAPVNTVAIQPGQFVQSALSNKAQVELTAVRRVPGAPDEVSVEMKINSLTDDTVGSDVISVGTTTARNPINSETYEAVDFLKRSSGSVSLFQMRQGQPVEGYVVLKVPQGINAIDIFVPETAAFKNVAIADANQVSTGANNSPVIPSSSTPLQTTTAQAPSSNIAVQPGQFVQPAFGTKGQVELLSVKRIQDPEIGIQNVVNVQMRIRRVEPDRVYGSDAISIGGTTARNPDTSETYKAVSYDRSTGSVSLFLMRPGASADAYVWLRVPEGVNTLDIFVPDTAAFKNVPISR